jgi:hypothetical protein
MTITYPHTHAAERLTRKGLRRVIDIEIEIAPIAPRADTQFAFPGRAVEATYIWHHAWKWSGRRREGRVAAWGEGLLHLLVGVCSDALFCAGVRYAFRFAGSDAGVGARDKVDV